MSRNVLLAVATVPAVLPAGITAGLLRLSILNASDLSEVAHQDVSGLSAQFTDIADGDYVAQAQRLDSTGADLGTAVQTPFSVADLLFDQPVAPIAVTIT